MIKVEREVGKLLTAEKAVADQVSPCKISPTVSLPVLKFEDVLTSFSAFLTLVPTLYCS